MLAATGPPCSQPRRGMILPRCSSASYKIKPAKNSSITPAWSRLNVWGKAWARMEGQIAALWAGACFAQNFFDCRQQLDGCEGFLQLCGQLRPLVALQFLKTGRSRHQNDRQVVAC